MRRTYAAEKSTYFNGGLFAGISLSIRFNRLILFRVLACFFIGLYKIFLSYLLLSCQGLILSTHAVCHYLLPFLSDSLVVCCLSSYVPFLVALSLLHHRIGDLERFRHEVELGNKLHHRIGDLEM